MVKVRTSQIPEQDGKPKHMKREPNLFDDTEDDVKGLINVSTSDCEDDNELKIIRSFLYLKDIGASISVFGIETIEKEFRLVESNYGGDKVKCEYGIIINKNIEPSMRYPRTDIELWYNSEEVRDGKYERLLTVLGSYGVNFIEV